MPGEHHSIGRLTVDSTAIFIAKRASVVQTIVVCNTDSSNRTYSIQHVPADESSSDDHALFSGTILRSETTQVLDSIIYMDVGDRIEASASVAAKVALSLYCQDYDSYLRGTS